MKQKQRTWRQHFVSEFYLEQFAIEKPKQGFRLRAFDVRAMRIRKRSYSPGGVCWKKFFYAAVTGVEDETSQYYEEVFGRFETVFSAALPGIIKRAVAQELTNDDLEHLAFIMTVQWIRTPSMREFVQFTKSDNSSHLNLIRKEHVNGFHNLFLEKKWRIHLSQDPYHFITSDNPVVHWKPPMTGLIPVTFMDGSHLFALTPKILIETTRPRTMDPAQRPIDRLFYGTDTDKGSLAFIFNRVIASQAHQYAYAPQTSEFERILTAI